MIATGGLLEVAEQKEVSSKALVRFVGRLLTSITVHRCGAIASDLFAPRVLRTLANI
jgi:hypothetical protein